jgi:hypothetical protein
MIWLQSALTGLVAAVVTIAAIVLATATLSMSAGEGSGPALPRRAGVRARIPMDVSTPAARAVEVALISLG